MPTELNIWTPDGIIPVGDGNAAYDAGNSGIYSASAINTNSPGHPSFNSNTPVVNIPDQVIGGGSQFGPLLPANPHGGEPKIGNYSTGTFTPTAAMISNQANTNKYPLNDYSADDRFRTDGGMQPNRGVTPDSTAPNTSPSGGGGRAQSTGPAPIPQVLLSQNLTQRPQTGNIYAPDLSAYNDSSLFNYTGPGGVDEYTYGQGLPYEGAGYDIWGSPTDIANPYYEGQFAPMNTPAVTQPESVGPADSAITMPAVQLPESVPQIINNTIPAGIAPISATTPAPGDLKDLTYAEHLAEMGINPADAPSTTFPSPGESNLSLAERQAQQMGTDNWDAMVAQADAMDKQLREGQLSSYDPYKGEAELNKDVGKLVETLPLGTPNPQGGLPVYESSDGSAYNPETGTVSSFTPDYSADSRFRPEGSPDAENVNSYLARDVAKGMNENLEGLLAKGQALQDMYDAQERVQTKDRVLDQQFDRNQAEYKAPLFDGDALEAAIENEEFTGTKQITDFVDAIDGDTNAYKKILAQDGEISSGRGGIPVARLISDGDSENIFQTQDVEADAYQRALDKERYQTQINNPTADFSGYMKNYGSGFKEPQASLSDVTDATPMQFANSASQMEVANTNIFNEKRDNSIFAKGPSETSTEIKSVFDEQQNYEVPASEMSPGETGLINGIVEGLQAFGPNDIRTTGEQNAWNEYNSYKDAGIKALNNGEIDEKAFNEIKGKAGSETVVNHFVDSSKNPKINNFMTNASNIFYQAMDVIVGDDSIKDGIVDYYQQKKGVNSSVPLGSVAEEIAKAKEATQQRKEVQENIFTPGPMKFAAAASSPKPVVVKKDKPSRKPVKTTTSVVKTSKPSRTPTKKTTSKPNYGYTRTYSRRYGL